MLDPATAPGSTSRSPGRSSIAELDLSQRLGANGKALLEPGVVLVSPPGAALDTGIKSARLRQLELANERAVAAVAAGSGRFARTDDVKQQLGAVAACMLTTFEAAFLPIANAIIASKATTPADVLRTMRATWREVRAQAAKAQGEEALSMPPMVDDVAG